MIQALPKNTGVFEEVIKQNSPVPTNQLPPANVSERNVLNIPSKTDVNTLKETKDSYEKSTKSESYGSFWKTQLRTSL